MSVAFGSGVGRSKLYSDKTLASAADIMAHACEQRRPDPRTVLLSVFVINALVMGRTGLLTVVITSGVIFMALVVARAMKWALIFLLAQSFLLFLAIGLPFLWVNKVTAFLVILGYWTCKLCAAFGIAAYAFRVVFPDELVAALRRMHIPTAVTVPLVVLFRFIPTVFSEYQAVREAMALRGIQTGWKALLRPFAYLEFVLVRLLFSCSRIADEMTAAGMVRGLGSKIQPTTLKPLKFGFRDLLWLIVIALLTIVVWKTRNITLIPGGFQ
ncbi:MAG: energy-coupling factor transporter transmembrane component T [Corynebacterium sp.]|nr:energy-coupling factor transporter transmembrane component T [Corynebacterium sp.]